MRYKGVHKALPEIARELERRRDARGLGPAGGQARAHQRAARLGARATRRCGATATTASSRTCSTCRARSRQGGGQGDRAAAHAARGEAARPAARGEPGGAPRVPEGPARRRGHVAAGDRAEPAALQRALELDPSFAPAWAGVADCHTIRGEPRHGAAGRGSPRHARAAARRALELDESLADAHAVLGGVDARELDLERAVPLAPERAIELNPGLDRGAHHARAASTTAPSATPRRRRRCSRRSASTRCR